MSAEKNINIYSLPVSAPMMNKMVVVYPTLLWDDQNVVLIDTAYPGQLPLLREAIVRAGVNPDNIDRLILTHQDLDHIGCAASLIESCPNRITVLAHEEEVLYIEGEKRLLKLTNEAIDNAVHSLPLDVAPEWKAAFRRTLEHPPRAKVDEVVRSVEELPYCGGITVIPSPGHTPGHISLYHKQTKTLIAGDALRIENGLLDLPDPETCSDFELAKTALQTFQELPIERILCHHGGEFVGEAHAAINELKSTYLG
ncbi:MBL fold metallo-hydrolase [Paenibacillus sp. GCM10027627]|uniref:MBL fold metallo-hydrolase n=1 Tax=unclassified Paenibacillus TaxID=185978 RepID=UPI003645F0DF